MTEAYKNVDPTAPEIEMKYTWRRRPKSEPEPAFFGTLNNWNVDQRFCWANFVDSIEVAPATLAHLEMVDFVVLAVEQSFVSLMKNRSIGEFPF